MKRIKVLFLIGSFGIGGKERQLAELITSLNQERFELHLLIKNSGAHYLDGLIPKLSSFHDLNRNRFGIKAILDLNRIIKEINPDIIHSWAEPATIFALCIRFFFFNKSKIIDGSIRSTIAYKNPYGIEPIIRMIINQFSDLVISNSKLGLKVFKVPKSKGQVIYNGFNNNRISNLTDKSLLKNELKVENKKIVGMVARFEDPKDWGTFINAGLLISELREDIVFIGVGGGKQLAHFKDLIPLNKRNNILLLGERSDVESLINIFDIAVLSSRSEGISNSILEYFALKKLVLVNNTGATSEVVKDGFNGIYFETENEIDLKNKILESLILKLGNEKIILNASNILNSQFSIYKSVCSFENIYKIQANRNLGL